MERKARMSISERKLKILKAIVDDYITTGTPVGSRTISKREDINLSPATIRNEMADLEEEGYLEQPHTSSGRRPSDKAFRLYVDTFMRVSQLTDEELKFVKGYLNRKYSEMNDIVDVTAEVLSDLTKLTSVVIESKSEEDELKRIQIVKLSDRKAVLVLIFASGSVRDVMIDVPKDINEEYLENLSGWLSRFVENRNLEDALTQIRSGAENDLRLHQRFGEEIINLVLDNIRKNAPRKNVALGGARNILNYPEYQDVESAKNFLTLLDKKDALYDILSDSNGLEFQIRIGNENKQEQLKHMSVITASYRINSRSIGTFGLIGPTRMDYGRVLSILQFIGQTINGMFDDGDDKDK
jgi:heat-inducible transcriptional repressor